MNKFFYKFTNRIMTSVSSQEPGYQIAGEKIPYQNFDRWNLIDDKPTNIFEYSAFYVSKDGDKFGFKGEEDWQYLKCAFEDELIKAGDTEQWRVKTETDFTADRIAKAKSNVVANIDAFKNSLFAKYTDTEQQGWLAFLPEAKIFVESGNPQDAPGLSLQAATRGIEIMDIARGIIFAAQLTGLLPHLAAGIRGRANDLLDATDGSEAEIAAIMELLATKQVMIKSAILAGDAQAVMQAASTGWDT